jgi:hypothetical protein
VHGKLGFLPGLVEFAMTYHPEFYKVAPGAVGGDLPDPAEASAAVHHDPPEYARS